MTTYVYFISAGANPIKIGISDNPGERLAALQTAHYKRLHLLFVIACSSREDAFKLETAFHRWYEDKGLLNEWFDIFPSAIQADITLLMELAKAAVEFQPVAGFKTIEYLEERVRSRITTTGELALSPVEARGDQFVRRCPVCKREFVGYTPRQATNKLTAHLKAHRNEERSASSFSTNGHDQAVIEE